MWSRFWCGSCLTSVSGHEEEAGSGCWKCWIHLPSGHGGITWLALRHWVLSSSKVTLLQSFVLVTWTLSSSLMFTCCQGAHTGVPHSVTRWMIALYRTEMVFGATIGEALLNQPRLMEKSFSSRLNTCDVPVSCTSGLYLVCSLYHFDMKCFWSDPCLCGTRMK